MVAYVLLQGYLHDLCLFIRLGILRFSFKVVCILHDVEADHMVDLVCPKDGLLNL